MIHKIDPDEQIPTVVFRDILGRHELEPMSLSSFLVSEDFDDFAKYRILCRLSSWMPNIHQTILENLIYFDAVETVLRQVKLGVIKATVTSGLMGTITYQKKDGTVRTLNGRSGVRKHVKGTGKPHTNPKSFSFYETSKGYRTLYFAQILETNFQGSHIVWRSPTKS